MCLNVGPAGFGNLLDVVYGLSNVARCVKQGQLALVAEFVLMRLHAQQDPTLAGSDRAAEIAQFVAACVLDALDRPGNTAAHLLFLGLYHLLEVAHQRRRERLLVLERWRGSRLGLRNSIRGALRGLTG